METVVPIISIKVENVADININKFDDMTKELEKIAEETRLKDEAWKEERRKLELQRMEEAIENKQKIENLTNYQRQLSKKVREERDKTECKDGSKNSSFGRKGSFRYRK